MKLSSKKGFTLVELIIVIAILGIIALIAVPSLTNVQKSSQVNADIRTAEQIGKAVRIWLTDADINTANGREGLIETNWTKLSDLGGGNDTDNKTLDKYISTSYKPQALKDASFYIKLVSTKVQVAIDKTTGFTAATASAIYELSDTEEATAGVAYKEGQTTL